MDAELASLVACRSNDATGFRPADGDGPIAKIGIIALLDGGVKGIHVDMNDLALFLRSVGGSVEHHRNGCDITLNILGHRPVS
ncbi:hypothetical protein GGE50_003831 [Rhizobium leguminosarum]|nr:hypothetical protein [Rhizobium leguminosarum]